MNIQDDVAYVFTDDGKVMRIKRLGQMTMGQKIMFTNDDLVQVKSKKPLLWRAKILVPALVLFMMIGLFQSSVDDAFAIVSVDINPSLSLYLNKDAEIIKVVAHNVDAEDLLSTLNNIKGMYVSDAVSFIIKASDVKYITDDNDDVFISTAILKEGMKSNSDELLNEIVEKTSEETFEEDVLIYTATMDVETYKASKAKNISMTNYVFNESDSDTEEIVAESDDETDDDADETTDENENLKVEVKNELKSQNASETAYMHANVKSALFKMTQIDNPEDHETTLDRYNALKAQEKDQAKFGDTEDEDSDTLLGEADDDDDEDEDEDEEDRNDDKGNHSNANANLNNNKSTSNSNTINATTDTTTSASQQPANGQTSNNQTQNNSKVNNSGSNNTTNDSNVKNNNSSKDDDLDEEDDHDEEDEDEVKRREGKNNSKQNESRENESEDESDDD